MSRCQRNMVAGNTASCLSQASRHEEFFHRKVGKLYNCGIPDFDSGKQTGARREHGVHRMFWAPTSPKGGSWSCVKIKCEELCELLDAKWAGCHRNSLEDTVCKFPVRL